MSFFKHPAKVCMTYKQHFIFSMGISKQFLEGSYKALVHAIIPDIYITSTSDIVKNVNHKLENSGCRDKIKKV